MLNSQKENSHHYRCLFCVSPFFFFLYTCADRTALICYITASGQPAHERRCTRIQGEQNFRRTFGCFHCESRAKLKIVSQSVYDYVDNRGKWSYRVFSAWFSFEKHQTCFSCSDRRYRWFKWKILLQTFCQATNSEPHCGSWSCSLWVSLISFHLQDSQFANPSHTVTP